MTKPVSGSKNDRLIVSGITGDWAFAAGSLLLALIRHNPRLAANNLQQRLTAAEAARARLETLLHRLGSDV